MRYLRQALTGDVYPWTPLLAARTDMTEIVVSVPPAPESPAPESSVKKRGRPKKERADDAG